MAIMGSDNSASDESAPWLFGPRISIAYCCVFAFAGMALPYFPLWLQFKGLSDFQIGIVLSAPMIMRVFSSGPMIAYADTRPDRANFTIILYIASSLMMMLYAFVNGFWWILAVTIAMNFFFNPVIPLVDAIAMSGVRRYEANYGRIRIWGSVIFIVANLAGGQYLLNSPGEYILYALIGALVVGSFLILTLPKIGKRRNLSQSGLDQFSFSRMLKMPRFMLVLLAAGILQASHALVYSFGSIYWQSLDYSGLTIGFLWGLAVAAEVVLFQYGNWLIKNIGTMGLFAIGGIAAVLRWTVFPLDPGLTGFLALQLLHGLTFGAVHIATMYFIMESVPEERIASAQGVGFVLAGLVMAIAVFSSGFIYKNFAANGFWIMAAMAVLALVLLKAATLFPTIKNNEAEA
ncbi:MAG: hypothetical protein COB78_01910 [Hyphomicrobiales bacterium]|nr:MAG: hypothetical protein COB78_01910 [Hyphomicrobiales bacterium]